MVSCRLSHRSAEGVAGAVAPARPAFPARCGPLARGQRDLEAGRLPRQPCKPAKKPADGLAGFGGYIPTSRLPGLPFCPFPAVFWPMPDDGVGHGEQARPVRTFPSALCSMPGPAGPLGASLWRDAPSSRHLPHGAARRAAEGKGGASWRRDRTRAQPRAGPLGPSMASTGRTHPLPAASTGAPVLGAGSASCPQGKVVHSGKFNFFLSSDSGPCNVLTLFMKTRSDRSKRAG